MCFSRKKLAGMRFILSAVTFSAYSSAISITESTLQLMQH